MSAEPERAGSEGGRHNEIKMDERLSKLAGWLIRATDFAQVTFDSWPRGAGMLPLLSARSLLARVRTISLRLEAPNGA